MASPPRPGKLYSRCSVSPTARASLVCMSMQYAQPFSCEARTRISSRSFGSMPGPVEFLGRRLVEMRERAGEPRRVLVEVEPGRGRGGVRGVCCRRHDTQRYAAISPLIWSTLMAKTWATSGLDLHLDLGPGPDGGRLGPPGAGPAGGGAARRGPDRAARPGHPAAVLPRARRRPWPGPQHGGRGLRPAGRGRLADRAAWLGHRGGGSRGGRRPGRSPAPRGGHTGWPGSGSVRLDGRRAGPAAAL